MRTGAATSTFSEPFDLLVRARRILTSGGRLDGGIGIREGRIAILTSEAGVDYATARTTAVLDVGDAVVLPGLVDTFAHMRRR